MDAYLTNLETVLRAEFDGNVIPIPLKKGKKTPLYSHKEKKTENLWKMWKNKGLADVLSETADLALLIRERAMVVVDFDNKGQAHDIEDKVQEFMDTVKESTKKGYHYFFKGTEQTKSMKLSNTVRPFGEDIDVDIITTWENDTGAIITVYPSTDKEWINNIIDKKILPMPQTFVEYFNSNKGTKVKNMETKNDNQETKAETNNKVDFEVLKEVVMGLKSTRGDKYEYYWRDITFAILNIAESNGYKKRANELIHEFSKQSKNYNDDTVEEFIMNARTRDNGFGLGTLLMFLKEDNEVLFHNIQGKLNPIKKVELKGYAFIDFEEPTMDLRDGAMRDYETIKPIFEQNNFKVSGEKVKFVQLTKPNNKITVTERTRKDLFEEFENLHSYTTDKKGNSVKTEFAKVWLKDPKIRTYEGIDFLPPPSKPNSKIYNTWKGFRAERIDLKITKEERVELLKPIYNHFSIICNHHAQSSRYVKKYLGHLIQKPGCLNGIALCFQSKEGTGKSTLVSEFFGKLIIGDEYYWESSNPVDDLFNKHSCAFHNRLLVNIDEPRAQDLRQYADRFKSLITNSTQRLEHKGKDMRQVNTCARYILTTNHPDVLCLTSSSRRYVLVSCSDEKIGDEEYFKFLYEYIERADVQRAFFDDMMEEDIEGFKWMHERPMTDAYIQNLDTCVPPLIRFMAGEVNMCEMCKVTDNQVKASDLFKKFKKILASCSSKYTCEYPTFTKWIKNLGGVSKNKLSDGLYYNINIAELKAYLIKVEKFDFVNYQLYEDIDEV